MNGVERSNDGVVLKRCPFCGGRVAMNQDDYGYYVSCSEEGCVVMTNSYAEKEAVEKWNNRKPPERVIERLDRELKIAKKEMEDCTFKGLPFYDTQNGYAKAMYKAIKIIEQELM